MRSWPLRRLLWLLVAIPCSVTLIISVVSLLGLRALDNKVVEVTEVTGPALSLNSDLLQTMTDAETGLRGYIASGNPELLAPYNHALRRRAVLQSRLDRVLDRISGAVARKDEAQDAVIDRWWRYSGRAISQGAGAQGTLLAGKALFDQIRRANAALADTLMAEQHRLRAQAAQTLTDIVVTVLVVTAISLLAGFLVASRLSRMVTGPIGRLRQVVLRQRTGDDRARADEDHGPVEVRDLAGAFNALSARNVKLAVAQAEALRLQEEAFAAGRAIRLGSDAEDAMRIACGHIGTVLGARRVRAAAVNESPEITASAQWHWADLADLPDMAADAAPRLWELATGLWADGRQLVVSDLLAAGGQEEGWPQWVHRETGATALLLAPAGLGNRVAGAVTVMMDAGPRVWTAPEVAFVQQVANFLARAIVQAGADAQRAEYTARLESLDRQKTEFLSTVSHELRTPLTSIQGYLELLREGDAGPVADEQQHMLAIIDRNATRLRGLIEDILVLNRIESGGLVVGNAEVSLRGLARNTAEELQPIADKASVQLRVDVTDDPGPVIGDRAQLQRSLVNIVSNAIKFTPGGGIVTLTCRTDPGGEVVITCQDTGIGIPKADIEHLFTRFFRASNATGLAIPGTGLGLAIVAAIVAVHHGELALDSVEGVGTTVTMRFPLATAHAEV
jgi:two-component system, OmpR family, phosphate regulon sensor histidine kinase PhoR